MKEIQIRKQPVELYKILKFEGLADSGGEAKALIDAGNVTVNGKVELRKRNKIVAGDIIGFRGEEFRMVIDEAGIADVQVKSAAGDGQSGEQPGQVGEGAGEDAEEQ